VPGVRVLIALGGNAMTGPDGSAAPADQDRAIAVAMERVADLVAEGVDVLLTHGNGPQVGNLLVKNELAASVAGLGDVGAQVLGAVLPSRIEGVGLPIHFVAIPGIGLHLIDNAQLDDLADACVERRRWEFLLTLAPLRLQRGTASPINPIAMF